VYPSLQSLRPDGSTTGRKEAARHATTPRRLSFLHIKGHPEKMKTAIIAATAALISGAVSGWLGHGLGWSSGVIEGHSLGVLNCETRESCARFLPGAKAWLAGKGREQ
jgi:hypothetical protein